MFTIEKAKQLLRSVLRAEPDKFYSSIYTIVRDGIEDVTPAELPATLAVIATEVRVEAIAGQVKVLDQRLNALAKRYIKFEGEVKAPSAPPADEGTAGAASPSANGASADGYDGPPADPEEAKARELFAAADAAKAGPARAPSTGPAVRVSAAAGKAAPALPPAVEKPVEKPAAKT